MSVDLPERPPVELHELPPLPETFEEKEIRHRFALRARGGVPVPWGGGLLMSPHESFADKVKRHQTALQQRHGKFARSTEDDPPFGQAQLWYDDVSRIMPRSGRMVARQLARLADEDSRVTLKWSSLSDAVGRADKLGRPMAYTQRGVESLKKAGWLKVETTGQGFTARTTWYLLPGRQDDALRWDARDDENDENDELIV